jgi:hypothetical protein
MLTPAGPIIMSSAVCGFIPAMPVRPESIGLDGISIPGIPGIFAESGFTAAGPIFIPLISA